jgi:hypothetical protein
MTHYEELIEPVIEQHIKRWNYPRSLGAWRSHVRLMQDFARQRPSYVREHIMEHFGLDDTLQVTLNVDGDNHAGYIRINETDIHPKTRGVSTDTWPWNGIYFKEIPVTVTAVPSKGYRFSKWKGLHGDHPPDIHNPELTFNLVEDISITAIFEKKTGDYSPEPFDLADGMFLFDYWPADAAAGSYPDHMVFMYMDRKHPGTNAWTAGKVEMAYNRESGTRMAGLGSDGIALMNRDSDEGTTDYHENRLGAVILGLRTINRENINVQWTAGTLQPNSRDYAIRLEYRTGDSGAYKPLLDHRNLPVVYTRNDSEHHSQIMGPVKSSR